MAHTLPSREFRWSRSHAEDRERGEGVLVLVTCPGFLSHFSTELKSKKDLILTNVKVESQAGVKGKERNSGVRERTTDTFKNGQPCRVMREPDRIARQAGILPSVIKRHISQLQDFHFLVRGVKASGLKKITKEADPTRGPRGKREPWVKDCEREKGWRSVLLLDPTPSAQKVPPRAPVSGRALQSVSGGAG